MVKRICFFAAIISVLPAGSFGESIIYASEYTSTSAAQTMGYLRRQNLPTLKSVQPWENEYGPGLRITTQHYEILTTLLDPLILSQVPSFMEAAFNAYSGQIPYTIQTGSLSKIYLFADRGQWESFTKVYTGTQAAIYLKIRAGAYYLNGECVAYNIGRERTFSVMGHEGWHQFNSKYFKYRLPSWLDEGIAMLFEVSKYEKGLFTFEPDRNLYRMGMLKATLQGGKMIALKELMGTNPGEVIMAASEDALGAFYAQSYALVRFLRENDYGRHFADYQKMLLGSVKGTWPLDAEAKKMAMDRNIPLSVEWNHRIGPQIFEQYIGSDMPKIEKEYLIFCQKLVYRIRLN